MMKEDQGRKQGCGSPPVTYTLGIIHHARPRTNAPARLSDDVDAQGGREVKLQSTVDSGRNETQVHLPTFVNGAARKATTDIQQPTISRRSCVYVCVCERGGGEGEYRKGSDILLICKPMNTMRQLCMATARSMQQSVRYDWRGSWEQEVEGPPCPLYEQHTVW